jgi:uncharacterized protein YecE (DUF72 family)
MKAAGDMRIGISGWRYKGWRGTFYPAGLPQRKELGFASSRFNTIELNGSFYSLQRPESFERWYEETPPDFVFSVKGSRYLTHMLRLKAVEPGLANFFAQGLLAFKEKLGPILWQFPPSMKFDAERFADFFTLLPRTHKQAAALGKLHGEKLNGRVWLKVSQDWAMRHCVEIRNETFVCEEFVTLLRKHRIGLVVADTVEWPRLMDVTADFVYCRLHGDKELYASGYGKDAIEEWARRVLCWAHGGEVEDGKKASVKDARIRNTRDVFVYFDNDRKVRAPADARSLIERIALLNGDAGTRPRGEDPR